MIWHSIERNGVARRTGWRQFGGARCVRRDEVEVSGLVRVEKWWRSGGDLGVEGLVFEDGVEQARVGFMPGCRRRWWRSGGAAFGRSLETAVGFHEPVERPLPAVTERAGDPGHGRGRPPPRDRGREVSGLGRNPRVGAEPGTDRPADLGDLQGMRQPGAVKVVLARTERPGSCSAGDGTPPCGGCGRAKSGNCAAVFIVPSHAPASGVASRSHCKTCSPSGSRRAVSNPPEGWPADFQRSGRTESVVLVYRLQTAPGHERKAVRSKAPRAG